jgi:thioredoxin 1
VTFDPTYHEDDPTRDDIAQTPGLLLLEFGANWCGHCQAISATVKEWTNSRPDIRHVRIADARGKPLGRSFRVKLWPTLVFMRDGEVVTQLVRPTPTEIKTAFEQLRS